MEINNLETLTEKVYQEGIQKAEEASNKLLADAKNESEQIIEKAKQDAEKIISEAKVKAKKHNRSAEKELHLKSKQLINDLKKEISTLLSDKILGVSVNKAFNEVNFLQDAIIEAIKSWNSDVELELLLPQELEKKLAKNLESSLSKHLSNLRISFNDKLKDGFVITNKTDGYQLSFSENEFISLFSPYLSERVKSLVFSDSE